MNSHQYIGLDVHKKSIWYCAKNEEGQIVKEGRFEATRQGIAEWCRTRPCPWTGLMEATLFSHWIYDEMDPYAAELRMGHPAVMKKVLAAKHKSDRNDARRFAEMCRNGSVPALQVMSRELRSLRRQLRVRNLIKDKVVGLKNRIASLLMETGVAYSARRLHSNRYYEELIASNSVGAEIRPMLQLLRQLLRHLAAAQNAIFQNLEKAPEIKDRLHLLRTIPGVGRITALTWALEAGDVERFPSHSQTVSYCGLVSANNETAGKEKGGPLSKVRNRYLQHVLIEVGHIAPRLYWKYEEIYRKKAQERDANVAAIEVARKMVAFLLAVDRSGKPFQKQPQPDAPTSVATVGVIARESQTGPATES
jgi:transposase